MKYFILIVNIILNSAAIANGTSISAFGALFNEPLSQSEEALFSSTEDKNRVAFAKKSNFRGVICEKGTEIQYVNGVFAFQNNQVRDKDVCSFKGINFVGAAFTKAMILQQYGIIDKSLSNRMIVIYPSYSSDAEKALHVLGIKGKKFHSTANGPLLNESFTVYGENFPKGIYVNVDMKKDSKHPLVSLGPSDKLKSIPFRGANCSRLTSFKAPYAACYLAAPLELKGAKVISGIALFEINAKKNANIPRYLRNTPDGLILNGEQIPPMSTVKIEGDKFIKAAYEEEDYSQEAVEKAW